MLDRLCQSVRIDRNGADEQTFGNLVHRLVLGQLRKNLALAVLTYGLLKMERLFHHHNGLEKVVQASATSTDTGSLPDVVQE